MNIWNALDVLLICTLLLGLVIWWCLVPWALSDQTVNSFHALNLLPCYVRLLQIFELSEYFGTLLFTVFGMAQDTPLGVENHHAVAFKVDDILWYVYR